MPLAVLVVTTAILSSYGGQAAAVTQTQRDFTEGFSPMTECRKMEAAYHNGSEAPLKKGNRIISRRHAGDDSYVIETTTFCTDL